MEWTKRLIVEMAEAPRYCPRKACKRNRACMGPKVACYDEAETVLRKYYFPRLRAAIDADKLRRQAAGEWPPTANDPERR